MTLNMRTFCRALIASLFFCNGCQPVLESTFHLAAAPFEILNAIGGSIGGCRQQRVHVYLKYSVNDYVDLYMNGNKMSPNRSPFVQRSHGTDLFECTLDFRLLRDQSNDPAILQSVSSACDSRAAQSYLVDGKVGELTLAPIEVRWSSGARKELTPKLKFKSCGNSRVHANVSTYSADCLIRDMSVRPPDISEKRLDKVEIECFVVDYWSGA